MLHEKTVSKFKKKCGELAQKLPSDTNTPAKSFLVDDSSL
jgi:hypothetical protein